MFFVDTLLDDVSTSDESSCGLYTIESSRLGTSGHVDHDDHLRVDLPVDHLVFSLFLEFCWCDMRVLFTDLSHQLDELLTMFFEGSDSWIHITLER